MSIQTNQPPLVTAVIPTYRRPHMLKRAIESVLTQTYPYVRVCVYDNASGDETEAFVRELAQSDPRVYYYGHASNIGAMRNFLYGMERIDTPFFSFLSDDDWLLPRFYETALREFQKYPESRFVSLGCIVTDGQHILRRPSINRRCAGYYQPPQGFLVMLRDWLLVTWTSILFRREVIDEVGLVPKVDCLPIDLEYLLQISIQSPFFVSPEPGAMYMDNLTGHSSQTNLEYLWPCYLDLIDRVLRHESLPPTYREYGRNILLRRLKRRLIYSTISSLHQQEKVMAQMALEPLDDYFNAKLTVKWIRFLIELLGRHPKAFWPVIDLFVRNKHRLIGFMDNCQYVLNNIFPQSKGRIPS
jgi:glycosyltransferase involved in cell wall biosynthesis